MKAPFYKAYLEGQKKQEITDYIDSFSYEDCMNEDSVVEFSFFLDKAKSILNNIQIDTGMSVSFQFGFFGENPSKIHVATLKDIDPRYDSRGVSLTLRAYDKGVDMKRAGTGKVWKKSKVSDIVKTIAGKYKLAYEVHETTKIWSDIPQANLSDLEFLRYMADREENGSYTSYVRNNTLHFVKRGVSKKSFRTYTWAEGDTGEVISFDIKHRESRGKKGAHSTSLTGMSLADQKRIATTANNHTTKDNTVLGQIMTRFNAVNGDAIDSYIDKKIAHPADSEEATNLASTEYKTGKLEGIKATLTVLGNPHLECNTIITVLGVVDRYCGNWLIEKVSHNISSSGFLSVCELLKNGKQRGAGDAAAKTNTDAGGSGKPTIKARVYYAPSGERLQEIQRKDD